MGFVNLKKGRSGRRVSCLSVRRGGILRKQGLYLRQNPWRKEEGTRASDGLQLLHRVWLRARSRSSHRWSPRPDPSPHRDVIDVQTPLGEQLLHITVKRRYQPTASSMTSGSNCHHLKRPEPEGVGASNQPIRSHLQSCNTSLYPGVRRRTSAGRATNWIVVYSSI